MNRRAFLIGSLSTSAVALGAIASQDEAPTASPSAPRRYPVGIPVLEPGSRWAASVSGEAAIGSGGQVPEISDIMRTLDGDGWPARATWRGNIADWFFVPEDDEGHVVFFHHGVGHDDGWDETIFTLEGQSIAVTPAVHIIDDRAMFGSAVRIRGLSGRWGWANLTVRVRPKRGYENGATFRVWLNRNQAIKRPSVILAAAGVGDQIGDGNRRYSTLGEAISAGMDDELWLESGWDVRVRPGAIPAREAAIVRNRGPICVLPDTGVDPREVTFVGINTEGNVQINARRVSFFSCRFALWGVAAFRTPHAMAPGGKIYFREGCSLRDAVGLEDFESARAGGPRDQAGVPIGRPGNWRSHRFFNQAGTDGNVAMIGSGRAPVEIRMTHALAGVREAYRTVGEFGWSLSFPIGNDVYSNTGCLACEFTGFSNYWIRLHRMDRLQVAGPPERQKLGGDLNNVVRIPVSNGADLPAAKPVPGRLQATGDPARAVIQIPLSQQGQWWARCYRDGQLVPNTAKGWPEGGQYLDAIGPSYPTNRDGSRDMPDLGFACVGTEPGYVYLLADPGPLSEIAIFYAHGAHSIFVQGDWQSSPAPARNLVYAYCAFEHPEAYIQFQHGGLPNEKPVATVSIDPLGQASFSAPITCYEGQLIRLTDGPNEGSMLPVRRGVSRGTRALLDLTDVNPRTGRTRAILRSPVINASFEIHRAALQGFELTNSFTSGSTALGVIDGTLTGLVIRSSTIRQLTRHAELTLGVLLRPTLGSCWHGASIADSYLSGISLVPDGEQPSNQIAGWFRNNQWGAGRNYDRGAGGKSGRAEFVGGRSGEGLKLKASASGTPVDRLGRPKQIGVSPIGSDTV